MNSTDCPWKCDDIYECAAAREREVAGVSDIIPDCPRHGTWTEAARQFEEMEELDSLSGSPGPDGRRVGSAD